MHLYMLSKRYDDVRKRNSSDYEMTLWSGFKRVVSV